jgi:hypothetical protein
VERELKYKLDNIIHLLERLLDAAGAPMSEEKVECSIDGTPYYKSVSNGCPQCGTVRTVKEMWKEAGY